MAALAITATAVIPGAGAVLETKPALEAIAAGKAVYWDTTQLKLGLYKADGATAMIRSLYGLCVAGAGAAGQQCVVQRGGQVTMNAVLTKGRVFVGGAALAGDVAPAADIATGWYTAILGVALSTTVLLIGLQNSDVPAS